MNKMNKMEKTNLYRILCFKITDSVDTIYKICLSRLLNRKIQRRNRKIKINAYCIFKVGLLSSKKLFCLLQ